MNWWCIGFRNILVLLLQLLFGFPIVIIVKSIHVQLRFVEFTLGALLAIPESVVKLGHAFGIMVEDVGIKGACVDVSMLFTVGAIVSPHLSCIVIYNFLPKLGEPAFGMVRIFL